MNLNLLPSKAKFQAAKIKLRAKIRLAMLAILGVWLSAVVVVIALNSYVKIKINDATVQGKKIQDDYLALTDNIMTSQKIKYKAKMVGGVLNDRFEYGKAFELISNLFPPTVTLKSYDLQSGGIFEIRGITQGKSNIDSIEKTISNINMGSDPKLKQATLTSLSLKSGIWNFAMEVALK